MPAIRGYQDMGNGLLGRIFDNFAHFLHILACAFDGVAARKQYARQHGQRYQGCHALHAVLRGDGDGVVAGVHSTDHSQDSHWTRVVAINLAAAHHAHSREALDIQSVQVKEGVAQ